MIQSDSVCCPANPALSAVELNAFSEQVLRDFSHPRTRQPSPVRGEHLQKAGFIFPAPPGVHLPFPAIFVIIFPRVLQFATRVRRVSGSLGSQVLVTTVAVVSLLSHAVHSLPVSIPVVRLVRTSHDHPAIF